MLVDIPYGKRHVTLEIDVPCEVLRPNDVELKDDTETLSRALGHPLGKETFPEFASKVKRLLVIVTDATRPTPTARVLTQLHPTLSCHPDVTFLVATGTHRAPTEEEKKTIFGELFTEFRNRIHVHDAKKDEDLVYVGKTSRGTEVRLNRMVTEADGILTINNVKPHYFAGFTGGRKAFLPGVAAYRTIEMNHSHALSDAAQPMALEGNPVAEDMEEAARLLGDKMVFSIQTVVTAERRIYAASAGDLFGSFNAAVRHATTLDSVVLKAKGNIILTANQHPMDINLYQAQHALENAKLALEPPGITILISKCWDGVGNDAFLKLLDMVENPEDVERVLGKGYKLGYHKAARMMGMKRHTELWLVSDLDDEVARRAKMKPYHDIQEALDDAVAHVRSENREPRVVVMPNGGMTVPMLKGSLQ